MENGSLDGEWYVYHRIDDNDFACKYRTKVYITHKKPGMIAVSEVNESEDWMNIGVSTNIQQPLSNTQFDIVWIDRVDSSGEGLNTPHYYTIYVIDENLTVQINQNKNGKEDEFSYGCWFRNEYRENNTISEKGKCKIREVLRKQEH